MRAVLKAQINKSDRNDARGIAQMMRVGLYRPVHVKTLRRQKLRRLLTHRKLLQSKAITIDNDLRGTLRNFGLKVGITATDGRFECSSASCIAACWPSQVTTPGRGRRLSSGKQHGISVPAARLSLKTRLARTCVAEC